MSAPARSTPQVAAATCGFAWVVHIPKGAMLSFSVAAGATPPLGRSASPTVDGPVANGRGWSLTGTFGGAIF